MRGWRFPSKHKGEWGRDINLCVDWKCFCPLGRLRSLGPSWFEEGLNRRSRSCRLVEILLESDRSLLKKKKKKVWLVKHVYQNIIEHDREIFRAHCNFWYYGARFFLFFMLNDEMLWIVFISFMRMNERACVENQKEERRKNKFLTSVIDSTRQRFGFMNNEL